MCLFQPKKELSWLEKWKNDPKRLFSFILFLSTLNEVHFTMLKLQFIYMESGANTFLRFKKWSYSLTMLSHFEK